MKRFLILAALLPAACGTGVPLPFQPERKTLESTELIRPKADASLALTSIGGMPGALGRQLAEQVALQLRELGVPAFTDFANKSSWWLYGDYRPAPPRIDWTLIDPDGRGATNLSTAVAALPARAGAGDVAAMAKAATPDLEKVVRIDPGPEAVPQAQTVYLHGIDGAPGDGGTSLERAMRTELRRLGVNLVEAPEKDTLILSGQVAVSEAGAGEQRVRIDWTLMTGAGKQVGTISQNNAVPKGRLDGAWGDIAWVAAQGGALGLQELLKAAADREPAG